MLFFPSYIRVRWKERVSAMPKHRFCCNQRRPCRCCMESSVGSEENKPLLQNFLECILDLSPQEITGLELMDKELTKEELSDKTGVLDIKLKLTNGTVIDIEISFSARRPCLSENTSFAIRQNIAAA